MFLTINITPSTLSDALTLENVEALSTDATLRGVRSSVTLKEVGVDTLPTGVSVSGDTITFSGTGIIMDGWNLFGYGVVFADGCEVTRIRDCVFGYRDSTNLSARAAFIRLEPTATIDLIEWSSFFGPGYFGDAGGLQIPMFRESVLGDGATAITGTVVSWRRCEFFGWGSDCIKPGRNGVFEFNYFDCGVNLPTGTKEWASTTTYAVDDYAVNTDYKAFRSLQNGNLNNPLPTFGSDNAWWQTYDPHYDAVNPRRQTGDPQGQIWRACYFNRSLAYSHVTAAGYATGEVRSTSGGDNNAIRNVRNTGDTDLHNGITVEYCIITDKALRNISWPIAAGASSGTNQNYSIFQNLWIGPRDGGGTIDDTTGHVVANINTYTTPGGAAAGYDGPTFV